MLSRFLRFTLPLLLVPAATFTAPAQTRIASVDNAARVAVPNTTPPRTRTATDLGPAPANRSLQNVTLRFNMTSAQQAALSQLLSDQQNPSSPQYHQWLTPEQFGAQFGLTSADLAQVSAWLTSQGLTVTEVARSSTFIRVSGTVAQLQNAFGTSIHNVQLNGASHIANITDVALPSSIAGVVTAVTGLDDFKPKPRISVTRAATPQFTSSNTHYIAPGDFYTIYNLTPLLNSNINGSTVGVGVGQGYGIAVMGEVQLTPSATGTLTDVVAFRSASGLSTSILPTQVLVGTNPGYPTTSCLSSNASSSCFPSADDLGESDLDVEWAGATAPGAKIAFVYSTDVFNLSLTSAIDNKTAPIISLSYGECEADFGAAGMAAYNQLFQLANAQGQTVVNAAGDSGATGCDGDQYDYPAVLGLTVGFPASSPYVTGVGGTMFNEASGTYWNSNGSSSVGNAGSALSYIPEVPWNETSNSNGLSSGNGGASAYFSKPAWQTGAGVPADSVRDVPDVSFNAAAVHDPYLYCSEGSCVNGFTAANGVSIAAAGGTSFGTPSFAGILALIEQKTGQNTGVGNVNPALYGLAALQHANATYQTTASALFNDITLGNNSSPCVAGTLNCPTGGYIGYTAAAGYDQATGWGSMNVSNAAIAWNSATPTGVGAPVRVSSYMTISSTAAACAVTATLPLTVTVVNGTVGSTASGITASSSAGVVPTGTVQFTVDGAVFGSPQPLSNGTLTYSLPISTLSGLHVIGAIYSGDSVYAATGGQLGSLTAGNNGYTTSAIDIVSSTNADFSMTPCTGTTTSNFDSTSGTIPLVITPLHGFTGTVTLSAGGIAYSYFGNGAPVGYSFSVSPVTLGATGTTTNLTLYAYQASGNTSLQPTKISALHRPIQGLPWYAPVSGGGVLACVLMFMVPRRRRWGALLAVVLSLAAINSIGCSSSSNSSGSSSGGTTTTTAGTVAAPAGEYIITVTATSGNIVHSSNITFTIN